MKKLLLSLFTLVLLFAFSTGVQAASFTFSGTDAGGTGSADMDISIVGNKLTAILDNTSSTTLEPPSTAENTPGITGFGFDLSNTTLLSLTSWTLTAYMKDLSGPETIGSPDASGVGTGADGTAGNTDDEWILNTTMAGVTLDFFPTTDQENIDGALFNPSAYGSSLLPGGQNDVFYTTAILTMNFNAAPVLDTNSPFVRMQNVGLDAEGSLKLYPIPEPATMLLFGSGLVVIAVSGKKRFKKRNG